MAKEVVNGRMIGGPGQTSESVKTFFGGQDFWGIPCGATEAKGDPYGRIVHDYGFYMKDAYSINAAHSSTAVQFLSFSERATVLEDITQYIKADLASGFRQFGTHPVDWRMQVYCNGPEEHYIDLACPFGKTNSPLEFCPPVKLFAKSAAIRYAKKMDCEAPCLGTHVDDIFGGFKFCRSYERAAHFRNYLCSIGSDLTLDFNLKPEKTPLPARKQVILGCLQNSEDKHIRTSDNKRTKYLSRINNLLNKDCVKVEELTRLHGNLTYAACVSPFGRPFLGPLMNLTINRTPTAEVSISPLVKMCLRVQKKILTANRGISFAFALNKLPRCATAIFVDASTDQGIGGCCGSAYFSYPQPQLTRFDVDVIARMELLACLVALVCFRGWIRGRLVTIYSDNENVVAWLKKGRSSNLLGMRLLAAQEVIKYKLECKTSPKQIPGIQNNTADALSRGRVPLWLVRQVSRTHCDLDKLAFRVHDAECSWDSIL